MSRSAEVSPLGFAIARARAVARRGLESGAAPGWPLTASAVTAGVASAVGLRSHPITSAATAARSGSVPPPERDSRETERRWMMGNGLLLWHCNVSFHGTRVPPRRFQHGWRARAPAQE